MLKSTLSTNVIKTAPAYFGGRFCRLSKKASLRAGLSFTQLGILLFELAPGITNALFPRKERPVKYRVPGGN